MIRKEFLQSLGNFETGVDRQTAMWQEAADAYSGADRHYHNLAHLDAVISELVPHRDAFQSWDTIVFAVAYHDLVYNVLMNNNESRSARLAASRLKSIGYPEDEVKRCSRLIMATRKHEAVDPETDLFTDADLAILGKDPGTYHEYTMQIRREYHIYPDLIYNAGRRKVLMHFLNMPSIYKTPQFAARYEVSARANLKAELG